MHHMFSQFCVANSKIDAVMLGSFLRQVAPRETVVGLVDQSARHRGRVQRRAAQRNIELPKEDKETDTPKGGLYGLGETHYAFSRSLRM